MDELYADRSGKGRPVLLLLHGMGANGAVWEPLLRLLEPTLDATFIVPDLRGHGRSPRSSVYSYGRHAADVAELVSRDVPLYVVGHSMGGAVALTLATGLFGVRPARVLAFSVKIDFSDTELERLATLASAPVKLFDSAEAAASRYLKVAGLEGLAAPDSAMSRAGIATEGERFRLAADMATVRAAGPSMHLLHAWARCPVDYACGERDAMASVDEMKTLGAPVRVISGAGHNLHVEQPDVVARLVTEWFTSKAAA